MQIELSKAEIDMIIEGLDHYRTGVAFKKGQSYVDKTEKLTAATALEEKLKRALAAAGAEPGE